MLDSREGICPGQAGLEYPATSVPFSKWVVPTFDHFLLPTRLTRRPAQPVAEHHIVRPAPGPHVDEPQVGLGHAIEGAMVAGQWQRRARAWCRRRHSDQRSTLLGSGVSRHTSATSNRRISGTLSGTSSATSAHLAAPAPTGAARARMTATKARAAIASVTCRYHAW
jgi:hypothetical protein